MGDFLRDGARAFGRLRFGRAYWDGGVGGGGR